MSSISLTYEQSKEAVGRPAYVENFMQGLADAHARFVFGLPESRLKSLFAELRRTDQVRYLQVSNEGDLPGLVAGAYLGGARALMISENSGLRQACEPIARLSFGHQIPLVIVLSYRGEFGERNWWGHNHALVMKPLLDALRIPYKVVSKVDDIALSITQAFDHADASQWPVCLILGGECQEGGIPNAKS